ncbi:hypothetical protein CDAR_387101 [Caerostris darwini]|uniref:HTH lacI-type domain-containing protein n=1 Tax=Caerostris darwini TaxID=1538125 RepID=A0AAV4RMI3_9ARAC|nr:hypothetical protein CDAR_387101 [Caerostris darwini]
MDIIPRKSIKIIVVNLHTPMRVRDIAAAVGVGKSSVSSIINPQNIIGTVSPKRKKNRQNISSHLEQTNFLYGIVKCILARQVQFCRENYWLLV